MHIYALLILTRPFGSQGPLGAVQHVPGVRDEPTGTVSGWIQTIIQLPSVDLLPRYLPSAIRSAPIR
jgi:hypothetical protein